jgi:hypothetical protein
VGHGSGPDRSVVGELEGGVLDAPTASGDSDEIGHRYWSAVVAVVAGQLAGLGDRASNHEQVAVGTGVDG